MRRLALYSFVITLLWLGFVGAISFMEAPLKFKAPGVQLKDALSIGLLVFHALNRMEWISAALSWLIVLRLAVVRTRGTMLLLGGVTAILLFQTFMLLPVLDARALAILHRQTSAATWHHTAYIAADVAKAILLGLLASAQIQSFARAVISE
jgi:hypothetical protein